MATDLRRDVLSLADFRDHLMQKLDEVEREDRTLVVTRSGRSAAIVLSPAEYERLRYRSFVRGKVAAGLADFAAGRTRAHTDVMRKALLRASPTRRRPGISARMPPNYWVIKSEPSEYSYDQLTKDKKTVWTGVRNFEARKNIRTMKPGDLALYYHSGDGKEIVGIARVASDPKADPTAKGEDWASVDMEPFLALKKSVPLAELKATTSLKEFPSVRKPRLSVAPVTPEQFEQVLKLAQTRLP